MTIAANPQGVMSSQDGLRYLLGRGPITLDASFWEAFSAMLPRERRQVKRDTESLEDATWEDAAFY